MNVAEKLNIVSENLPKVYNAGYEKGKNDNLSNKEEQEKTIEITENGTTEILPDDGKTLSKVNIEVDVKDEILFSDGGRTYAKKMVIPEGVTKIGKYAFEHCINLQEVILPEGVTKIEMYAFEHCINLQKVILPNNLRIIGRGAFLGTSLISVDDMLEQLTSLDAEAFYNVKTLTEVKIPANIKNIPSTLFYGCTSLEKVVIKKGVEKVGNQAFDNCPALKILYLPNTIIDMTGVYAVRGNNLEDVILEDGFNGKNLYLAHSTKYSVETIVSWGEALFDRTGLEPYTLTIGSENIKKLSDEQIAIFTNKNWNLA